jgi:hypothetical protein
MIGALLGLGAACGGGGGGGTDPVVPTYTVSGVVTGLTGSGLVVNNNGPSQPNCFCGDLPLPAGATSFALPGSAPTGTPYNLTVKVQPENPSQKCTILNGTGTLGTASVSNVTVSCETNVFAVGGTITGLAGGGLTLQLNGGATQSPAAGAGGFSFQGVPSGTTYAVTVGTQPSSPAQVCTVANGTGTVGATNVANIAVTCVTTGYSLGGAIAGLTGSGLVLQNNGGGDLTVPAGATSFTFPGTIAPGSTYSVTVKAQPNNPSHLCTIANGSGTVGAGNVTSVVVSCTANPPSTWNVGGTITGLSGSGLTLQLNGGTPLAIAAGATTFAFPGVATGSSYVVSVGTQPGNQTCTVSNGAGTVGNDNVTTVAVTCSGGTRYTIGGTITGLVGTGLSLTVNGGARVNPAAGATTFTFLGTYATGTAYTAIVSIQPSNPTQTCTMTNATGTVGTANVTNIAVVCTTGYSVGGTIANQNGNGLVLLLNGGSAITRNVDQSGFTFPVLPVGTPYSVTVGTQPTAPSQTCTVSNGNGTIGTANVTNVSVLCLNSGPVIGGGIQGYTGTGLTMRINGGTPWTPQARSKYVFPENYAPGSEFLVTIASQPTNPIQTCTVIRGAGSVPTTEPFNVQNILVQCTTNTTSPLAGTYSILLGGKRSYLTLWPDGTYAFVLRSDDASCGPSNGNGVEYGVYTYNAATQAFSILTGAIDSNGGCGLWDNAATPQVGLSGTLTKSGDTLTLTTSEGTFVLTAVTSTASSLIGSWQQAGDANGGFIVFHPDNTYLHVQTQAGMGAGFPVGYERGCYVATSSSITFSLAAPCAPDGAPPLDLNGSAGASGIANTAIPFVITGPNALTLGGDTFLVRIVPN